MAPCGFAGSAVLEPGAGPIRRGLRVRGVKLFYLGRSGRGFRTPRLAWSKRCRGTGGRRGVVHGALVVHRRGGVGCPGWRPEGQVARVHCGYDFDEMLGLVVLVVMEATVRQWIAVMDLDELCRVADAVTASGRADPERPFRAADLRRGGEAVTGGGPGAA